MDTTCPFWNTILKMQMNLSDQYVAAWPFTHLKGREMMKALHLTYPIPVLVLPIICVVLCCSVSNFVPFCRYLEVISMHCFVVRCFVVRCFTWVLESALVTFLGKEFHMIGFPYVKDLSPNLTVLDGGGTRSLTWWLERSCDLHSFGVDLCTSVAR